jgi:hypothetical protein
MIAILKRHFALHVLLTRAFVLYALIRIIVTIATVGAGPDGPGFDNPAGIVALVTILGVIDLRRRNERMLWQNLAYGTWQTSGLFTAVATVGELLIALFIN